ncbi:hypothetical protein FIBSPDRAFT_302358 [Athelia psychrophila]|uniref:Uncharacterized protein n=1 Tax=Athelia psychrophila TaxID=1759441 RepID=A0A167X4Q4_9AGAM|nr:hypothetical protein FIBSPDRAFT_302358 [Fibularhizoctonia sp. CBS 109695]
MGIYPATGNTTPTPPWRALSAGYALPPLIAWFFSLAPSSSPSSPCPPYPTSRGMIVQGMKRISSTRIRWWTMKMPRRQPSGRLDAGWGRENDSRERREGQHVPRKRFNRAGRLHAEIVYGEMTIALRVFSSSLPCLHLLRGSRCPGCAHGDRFRNLTCGVKTDGNSGATVGSYAWLWRSSSFSKGRQRLRGEAGGPSAHRRAQRLRDGRGG